MSLKAIVYNQEGKKSGEIELPAEVFAVETNMALLHQAAVAQMGNERQVLADTKDRSEVSGGGKKPWKQKGTGRARVGSSRSPIWRGGGVTFGPLSERNFSKKINKKSKQKAIFMALTDKLKSENLLVADTLAMEDFNTKKFNEVLGKLEDNIVNKGKRRNVLVINEKKDEKVKKSGANLAGVMMMNAENINILDLLKYKNLIMTVGVVEKLKTLYVKAA